MGKKSKGGNLGRALIRDRFGQGHRRTVDNNSMVMISMCSYSISLFLLSLTYGQEVFI